MRGEVSIAELPEVRSCLDGGKPTRYDARVNTRIALGVLVLATACYSGRTADQAATETDSHSQGDASGDASGDATGDETGGETGDALECGPGLAENSPLRRLTKFEYNNTVQALLGDDTSPANAFPSEELGNGFGNDADAQAVSSLLVEKYVAVAEGVAARATATPEDLARLAACAGEVTEGTDRGVEDACALSFIEDFVARAYRRPLEEGEAEELFALQQLVRADATFATSMATVIEAVLQSPSFLYRVERGVVDGKGRRRPSGYEMATRLSYFFWGSMPDEELFAAAQTDELLTNEGVLAQAERLLADPRSRTVVRFFFDHLLPISGLSSLERDEMLYPTFSAAIGASMTEETQRFLEHVIFESSGTWNEALTADYTFVNGPLAQYYGYEGVEGEEFQQVSLDTTQRLGLMTQGGVVAGTIHSNLTNPVVRGSHLVQKLLCIAIPLPTGDVLDQVKPPEPDSGATARERYIQHSEDPVCASCHKLMDPAGFALENYDAVGLWRDTENGQLIDASGSLPTGASVSGPVDLMRKLAAAPETYTCFSRHWGNFAYGRTLDGGDKCLKEQIDSAFIESGNDIQALLLAITQTDAFLYLPEPGADQ